MATNQMRREAAKRKLERQQERREMQTKRRQRVAVITSAAVVVVVVVGIVLLTTLGGGSETTDVAAPPDDDPVAAVDIPTELAPVPARSTPLPNPTSCDYVAGGEAAKPAELPPATDVSSEGTQAVTLNTSAGVVPLALDRALAPCTVNSFVSLVQQGYYDGTPCHRLTTSPGLQVLQCGDPTGSGTGGPGYTIPDEVFAELAYGRGILAMAKTPEPDSGGSQFFMVYGTADLPPEYTAFGTISPEGLSVVDEVARAGSTPQGDGAPNQPVTIETATVG
ncbi:peptidylprolyl isomerase [Pseudonocardia sp.]|uniref:peptidylprolyl isomerase n=1 Tax=Pseudonocardia sp. TaxID=60912 RepID=UPI0026139F8C|nr:peptidylprolyl isomerase [Pseudonocardia sp.]